MAFFQNMFGGGNQPAADSGGGGDNQGDGTQQRSQSGNGQGTSQQQEPAFDPNADPDAQDFKSLEDIFNPPPPPKETQQQQQQPIQQPTQQQQQPAKKSPEQEINDQIIKLFQGLTPPEDSIPENFNPSDPKQLRDVLSKTQQQTALTTLQAVMLPVKAAMESLSSEVGKQIQDAFRQYGMQNQTDQILESIVPEIKTKAKEGLVRTMFEAAMKRHSNDARAAANAVNEALKGMKLKDEPTGRQRGTNPSGEDSNFLEGSKALDRFFPANPGRK